MLIHARSEWGGPSFAGTPSVPDSQRTEFYVHYEGGVPTRDTGAAAMRSINAGHLANGWAGIGYSFVVFQDGSIWEGRGWLLAGAHCPGHNSSAWGVQVHVGGDQRPSDAALAAVDDLYDEACRRAGRKLAKRGHRDGYATECPGGQLYSWVLAGMPRPKTTTPAAPAAPPEEEPLMRTLIVRCAETGECFEVLDTQLGPRLFYVPSPDEIGQELALKGREVQYETKAEMEAEFPRSTAKVIA